MAPEILRVPDSIRQGVRHGRKTDPFFLSGQSIEGCDTLTG